MTDSSDLIGTIRTSKFPYYDVREKKIKYKSRPILVINAEKDLIPCDLTVLPISRVTEERHIHEEYDLKVLKSDYPLLNLKENKSYIRTHKVNTVNSNDVANKEMSSLKNTYPDLYSVSIAKVKQFIDEIN
ncbi:hypothetical protein ACSDJ2_08230 [Listeria monocytogenes]